MHKLFIGLLSAFALTLSACTEDSLNVAGSSGGGKKTAVERKLEQDVRSLNQQTKSIVVKNTVQGALVGAAVGCGFALILGGNGSDCAKAGAAGAVIGGAAGNNVGKKAAKVNQELVKQRAVIANLSKINGRLGSIQANLRSVVRSQNAELSSLRRQVAAKQVSASQYNARLRAIQSNRKNIRSGLATAENNVAKSRVELVKLEKKGGKSLTQSKNAASSTQRRLANIRKSVRLVSS